MERQKEEQRRKEREAERQRIYEEEKKRREAERLKLQQEIAKRDEEMRAVRSFFFKLQFVCESCDYYVSYRFALSPLLSPSLEDVSLYLIYVAFVSLTVPHTARSRAACHGGAAATGARGAPAAGGGGEEG